MTGIHIRHGYVRLIRLFVRTNLVRQREILLEIARRDVDVEVDEVRELDAQAKVFGELMSVHEAQVMEAFLEGIGCALSTDLGDTTGDEVIVEREVHLMVEVVVTQLGVDDIR